MRTDVQIVEFNKVPDYNGYTNKPTWVVSLWINNDQGLQQAVLEAAQDYVKSDAESAQYDLADWLKNEFSDEQNPIYADASMYSDLLNWALAYVDWDELAEHFIEAAKEIS